MLTLVKNFKELALEKMLKEMEQEHTSTEDSIHNWLCNQDDDELFKCILKDDRSINGAIGYCAKRAKDQSSGNAAMIDDATVYEWVREYFTADKVDVKPMPVKVVKSDPKPKPKKEANKATPVKKWSKKKPDVNEGLQFSLFDDL